VLRANVLHNRLRHRAFLRRRLAHMPGHGRDCVEYAPELARDRDSGVLKRAPGPNLPA
jgi:hypothetical protein